MEVTVADDEDVDESSLDASDFSLSNGSLSKIGINESGSNARIKLFLLNRLHTDTVTITVASEANITDIAGNKLANGSVTVTGMDSYLPSPREFEITRLNASTARMTVRSNEPLSGLGLNVDGPSRRNLALSDFHAVDDTQYGIPYVTVQRFPTDGTYRIDTVSVTDNTGNLVNYTRERSFISDGTPPDAIIEGPYDAYTGDTVRFTGSNSTDNVGIDSYRWWIDGNASATDITSAYTFWKPGRHTVTLTVLDGRGNKSTTNRSVGVHRTTSKRGVEVTPKGNDSVRATITDNRTNARVRVADKYGHLLDGGPVTLDWVTVTVPANETASLELAGNATAPSFENETGTDSLAAFSLGHGNTTLGRPALRFSVPAARLAASGHPYTDVVLFHDDGNWTELDTRVVRATATHVVYEATAPELSRFVVGTKTATTGSGVDGGSVSEDTALGGTGADITVTGSTLLTDTVTTGGYAVVEATFSNTGDENGAYVAGVTIGPDVVLTRPVVVAPGDSQRRQFATRDVRNGTVGVNGTIAGELSVVSGDGEDIGTDTGVARTDTEMAGQTDGVSDGIPVPNPLAFWPGGTGGAVLSWVVAVTVVTYGFLKTLAIYLGY